MQVIINFAGKTYSNVFFATAPEPKPIVVDQLSGAELLELYNLVSSNLGRGRVKRFADTKTAVRRTWGILQEYSTQPEEDPQEDTMAASLEQEELNKIQLSPEDKAQIADEAAERKSEALLQAVAAARTEPTAKRELWRRPKHENPAKTAYRPRAGSLQATMYDLLVTPGGIQVETFCTAVKATGTKDKTLFTPSNVWAAMRYLYVANRGYGLDFDGERLQLIVPKDERESSAAKKEG